VKVILLTEMSHISDTRVISGERFDGGIWKTCNGIVPPQTILRSGSVIEKDKEWAKRGIKEGWYGRIEDHKELEQVFPDMVMFMDKPSPLAEILRAHRIQTLEQVGENAEGRVPFSDGKQRGGTPIRVKEILRSYLTLTDVDKRVQQAREIVTE
jgi:hypothetical protein